MRHGSRVSRGFRPATTFPERWVRRGNVLPLYLTRQILLESCPASRREDLSPSFLKSPGSLLVIYAGDTTYSFLSLFAIFTHHKEKAILRRLKRGGFEQPVSFSRKNTSAVPQGKFHGQN